MTLFVTIKENFDMTRSLKITSNVLTSTTCSTRHYIGFVLILAVPLVGFAKLPSNEALLETVLVSASRDESVGNLLPLSWTLLNGDTINEISPQHSNQVFSRVSGAWVSRGNGQESLIALRSPVLTGAGSCGSFMTASDGIPLRAPGFCNLNQLFDVNILQAAKVEVLKGPASIVFGSNAMHGVINIFTLPVQQTPNQVRLEVGSRDYFRLSASGATKSASLSLQNSRYGGYQLTSGYEQQKATLRIDQNWRDWKITGVLDGSHLNQQTAGYIQGEDTYKNKKLRRENPNPEAYRDAWSLRGNLGLIREWDNSKIIIRPYLRANKMSFLQHYLPWQATETNQHKSLGLQISARGQSGQLHWLGGMDLDHTSGELLEVQNSAFSPNHPKGTHYDYQVAATMIAAFSHLNLNLKNNWRIETGIRLESTKFDYSTRIAPGRACLPSASACRFYRPENRDDSFTDWSGNLAFSRTLSNGLIYLRAARGFRTPQATELYRLQSGQAVAEIDSERINSIEIGLRGLVGAAAHYDLNAYVMNKSEVIFQDRDRFNIMGAKTTHKGIELSGGLRLASTLSLKGNISYAIHQYKNEIELFGSSGNISDNEMDTAPRHFGSMQILFDPLENEIPFTAELEWVWIAKYWLDPNNNHQYDGHELLNLRGSWKIKKNLNLTLIITNVLNQEYAERADYGFGSYRYFVGEPRSAVIGVTYAL